jgi:hypothetical protein
MRGLPFVLFFILVSSAAIAVLASDPRSSNQDVNGSVTEITENDFTQLATIRSTNLSVFGVRLGDSLSDAKANVERYGLRLVPARFPNGFSVYEKDGPAELIGLRTEEQRIVKIALFDGMAKYLAGESRLLMGDDVTRRDSPARLRLLGREDRRSDERDMDGHTVTCSYDKEGLLLIRSYSRLGDAPTVLHLIFPAKAR